LLVLAILFIPMGLLYSQTGVINELGTFRTKIGNIIAFGTYEQYGYTISTIDFSTYGLNIHDLTNINYPILIDTFPIALTTEDYDYCHIKIDGQRMAIASPRGIKIFSLSNPTAPLLINDIPCNGSMYAAILEGNWLYTLQNYYLKAYDISNPGPNAIADSVHVGDLYTISKVGNHILVGGSPRTYQIVDTSDPWNLSMPIYANTHNGHLYGVWNNRAFVSTYWAVDIYDISDIFNPSLIDRIVPNTAGFVYQVLVMDGYLVIKLDGPTNPHSTNWSEIYDISTDQPQFIVSLDGYAYTKVFTDSHSKIIKCDDASLRLLDLSLADYMSPDIPNDYIQYFSANSETVFMCFNTFEKMLVLDTQDPDPTPNVLNNVDAQLIAVKDDLMVTNNYSLDSQGPNPFSNLITLWNVEDQNNPIELSSFIFPESDVNIAKLHFERNWLLMLHQEGYVIVYDISNLQSPALMGVTDSSIYYVSADIRGDRLFCLRRGPSHFFIDEYILSSYGTVVFLGSYQHTGSARKLIAWENRLAVLGDSVWIFDATIPGAPALLSSVNTGTYLRDIVHRNNHLIILDQAGLGIYSLLPDGQTVLLATHNLSSLNYSIKLSGNIVLASSADRLTYLDCSEVFAMDNNDPQEGIVPAYSMTVYPNPSSGTTNIQIDCPGANGRTGEAQVARLDIYNLRGQKIRTLVNNEPVIGKRSFGWDGLSDSGMECSNGIYFLSLSINGKIHSTRKISLIRHGVR